LPASAVAPINKRDGKEIDKLLTALYNKVKNGNIDVSAFVRKAGFLIKIRIGIRERKFRTGR
jgi:hypothetical protein